MRSKDIDINFAKQCNSGKVTMIMQEQIQLYTRFAKMPANFLVVSMPYSASDPVVESRLTRLREQTTVCLLLVNRRLLLLATLLCCLSVVVATGVLSARPRRGHRSERPTGERIDVRRRSRQPREPPGGPGRVHAGPAIVFRAGSDGH